MNQYHVWNVIPFSQARQFSVWCKCRIHSRVANQHTVKSFLKKNDSFFSLQFKKIGCFTANRFVEDTHMKLLSIFHYCLPWYLPLPPNYITLSLPRTSVITSTPPDPKCFDRIFCLDCDTHCPDTKASPLRCGCFVPALLSFSLSLCQPPPPRCSLV